MAAALTSRKPNRPPRSWRFRLALVFLLLLSMYGVANTWVLGSGPVKTFLQARLAAAFGRPVEVGAFSLSVLPEPELVARAVTVEEDARFGAEHFVRAEKLSASLRWTAMLRGRMEFDTVTFTRPSLNLVRRPDGRWNLESWLPPLPGPGAGTDAGRAARLTRVRIREGRINFKRGTDKHPFALVNLEGTLTHDRAGRWSVDFESELFRAGVSVQQAGTLRLSGQLGGTQARLRPAQLELRWSKASLADVFRLLRGRDYGVRGQMDMEVSVRSGLPADSAREQRQEGANIASDEPATNWRFNLRARARGIHRWDFPERPGDPSLNLSADLAWNPEGANVRVSRLALEAPSSNLRGTGFVQWAHPQHSSIRLLSSGIAWNDLLAWLRAFRADVSPGLRIEGGMGLDAQLSGWPPRVERASLASDGARIRLPALAAPVFVSRAVLTGQGGRWQLSPLTLTLPGEAARGPASPDPRRGQVAVIASAAFGSKAEFQVRVSGATRSVEDFTGACAHFGFPLAAGWTMEGSARWQVNWQGTLWPASARLAGSARLTNLRLRPAFLNHPVLLRQAKIEWRESDQNATSTRITLEAAEAFGAKWTGFFARAPNASWQFALTADRLSLSELNAWLNPQRERTLLQRALARLPFARRSAAELDLDDQLKMLRASGRLQVGRFQLASLHLENLKGSAQLNARALLYQDAEADFYGGKIRGTLGAEFQTRPLYKTSFTFARVNLEKLVADVAELRGLFSGTAHGMMEMDMTGTTRAEILDSLKGQGQGKVDRAAYTGLDLSASILSGSQRSGRSEFRSAAAEFLIASRKIRISSMSLGDGSGYSLNGTVGFSGEIELNVLPVASSGSDEKRFEKEDLEMRFWMIAGTLKSPRIQQMTRQTTLVP
jgi:uncharacterized protein involved in outer membrane biogenesis